jgi:hypothetical protein
MNDGLERIKEGAVVTYFQNLPHNSTGGTEKYHKKVSHYNLCPGRDSHQDLANTSQYSYSLSLLVRSTSLDYSIYSFK